MLEWNWISDLEHQKQFLLTDSLPNISTSGYSDRDFRKIDVLLCSFESLFGVVKCSW